MININEIRVGNILLMKITKSWQVRPIKVNEFLALYKNPEWAKPIPLSEEILLKCGFDKHKYESFAKEINSNMILSVHLLKGMVYHTEFNGIIIDFQYLHQLQNLYFALTGQELNTSGL